MRRQVWLAVISLASIVLGVLGVMLAAAIVLFALLRVGFGGYSSLADEAVFMVLSALTAGTWFATAALRGVLKRERESSR